MLETSTITYHPNIADIFSLIESPEKIKLALYLDKVSAGFPSPASDYEENRLNPDDYLITNHAGTFFARVKGLSMIDAGIFENYVIVVDRSIHPKVGDIVLAVLDGEFTVKFLD